MIVVLSTGIVILLMLLSFVCGFDYGVRHGEENTAKRIWKARHK